MSLWRRFLSEAYRVAWTAKSWEIKPHPVTVKAVKATGNHLKAGRIGHALASAGKDDQALRILLFSMRGAGL